MKRAKLRGLEHDAAVVLGSIANPEDAAVLTHALDDEPLPSAGSGQAVREHAAWASNRLRPSG